jgi:hypothetical protein
MADYPPQCANKGKAGKGGDGADIKIFNAAECASLGGIHYPGADGYGECIVPSGGSWSWNCRNAPSAAPGGLTAANPTVQYALGGLAAVAVLAFLLKRK